MVAWELTAMRFGHRFDYHAKLTQIVDIGAPARGRIIDWRAAYGTGVHQPLQCPSHAASKRNMERN
tara:strand:+ start:1847 stop:2044 length:198 start_codon:yes stop_codon:yes gene_type:complete